MIDLGVNNLFDKIESHFGKWLTRIALFIMVLTIMVVCLNTIWTIAVAPLIESVQAAIRFQSVSSYWDLFKTATILLLGGALSITLVSNWRFRRTEKEFLQAMNEALEDPKLRDLLEEFKAEETLKKSAPKNSVVGQIVEDSQ